MRYEPETSPRRGQPDRAGDRLARTLGIVSIGIGLAEILAPRRITETVGLTGRENLVRAHGLREIATGIGLLAASDPAPFVWGRVVGDALDMASLAPGLEEDNPRRANAAIALAAVFGAAAVDLAIARRMSARTPHRPSPIRDYSTRSGFPRPPSAMRGSARRDFTQPRDMRRSLPQAGL